MAMESHPNLSSQRSLENCPLLLGAPNFVDDKTDRIPIIAVLFRFSLRFIGRKTMHVSVTYKVNAYK